MAITKIVLPLKSCFSAKGFSVAFANVNSDVDIESSRRNLLILTKRRYMITFGIDNNVQKESDR